MSVLHKSKRLKKELGLLSVYSLATGTTLSAGFFLLPGLAAEYAESAIVLAYLIAGLPLIPATFCIIELSTAMPRAGGVYYFLDRSLGPLNWNFAGQRAHNPATSEREIKNGATMKSCFLGFQ